MNFHTLFFFYLTTPLSNNFEGIVPYASLAFLNLSTFLELKKIQNTQELVSQEIIVQRRKEIKLSQTSLIIVFGKIYIVYN